MKDDYEEIKEEFTKKGFEVEEIQDKCGKYLKVKIGNYYFIFHFNSIKDMCYLSGVSYLEALK